MELVFNTAEQYIMELVRKAAVQIGVEAYPIGGFVRDKILGRATKDIDIVCNGDGIDLAHAVAELLPQPAKVAFFKTYGTAQLRIQGIEVEFVGARKESYSPDSRNP